MGDVVVTSESEGETETLAGRVADGSRVGDVVGVAGELGAGKTTFVRGACRALGVDVAGHEPDVHDRPPLRGARPGRAPRPLPPRRHGRGGLGRPRALLRWHDCIRRVARARGRLAACRARDGHARATSTRTAGASGSRVTTIFAFDTATSADRVLARVRRRGRRRAADRRPLGARGGRRARPRGRPRARRHRRARRRHRAGQLHVDPHRARDRPRARARARRSGGRRLDARRVRRRPARDRRPARRGLHRRAGARAGPRSSTSPASGSSATAPLRYRELFEAAGAEVPPDDDPAHLPSATLLAARAGAFGPADAIEPTLPACPRREADRMTAIGDRYPPARALRPERDRRDRAARLHARRGRARCSPPSSRRRARSASAPSTASG